MTTIKRSGGEVLIDGLIGHGASRLFCVPGESYLAVLDALHDHQNDIQVITCRQEGGAAFMAEAHGKMTGKPGLCFVSRGPGASNAMTGIHTAFQDSTPLLMFIGQVPRAHTGREAFQELDYRQVYGGVAKKVTKFHDAARIPEQLGQSWHCAMSGRPGPVVIELPEDMLRQSVEVDDLAPVTTAIPAPDPASMERISAMIAQATQPVLMVGGAGWTPAATTYLTRFVERHHFPVATAFRRSDSFDNSHPNYIGELGLAPNPALTKLIQGADLIIAVGPRIGDITTASYTTLDAPARANCNPQQKLVHVHISGDEINSVFRADLGIVSQPEQFFRAACQLDIRERGNQQLVEKGHLHYLDFVHQPRNTGATMRMDRICRFLRKRLPADSIITLGAGNFTVWGQRYYQYRQPRTQLGSTNGTMGYGVPSAIAAKLEKPNSIVVSFSGDGCFLMNGQELATAVQFGVNVIFLVVNNNCYGTIRTHQERRYPGRPSATYLRNPDFAALAMAYGAFGTTVTKAEEFEEAFEQALRAATPAVIEVQTDY